MRSTRLLVAAALLCLPLVSHAQVVAPPDCAGKACGLAVDDLAPLTVPNDATLGQPSAQGALEALRDRPIDEFPGCDNVGEAPVGDGLGGSTCTSVSGAQLTTGDNAPVDGATACPALSWHYLQTQGNGDKSDDVLHVCIQESPSVWILVGAGAQSEAQLESNIGTGVWTDADPFTVRVVDGGDGIIDAELASMLTAVGTTRGADVVIQGGDLEIRANFFQGNPADYSGSPKNLTIRGQGGGAAGVTTGGTIIRFNAVSQAGTGSCMWTVAGVGMRLFDLTLYAQGLTDYTLCVLGDENVAPQVQTVQNEYRRLHIEGGIEANIYIADNGGVGNNAQVDQSLFESITIEDNEAGTGTNKSAIKIDVDQTSKIVVRRSTFQEYSEKGIHIVNGAFEAEDLNLANNAGDCTDASDCYALYVEPGAVAKAVTLRHSHWEIDEGRLFKGNDSDNDYTRWFLLGGSYLIADPTHPELLTFDSSGMLYALGASFTNNGSTVVRTVDIQCNGCTDADGDERLRVFWDVHDRTDKSAAQGIQYTVDTQNDPITVAFSTEFAGSVSGLQEFQADVGGGTTDPVITITGGVNVTTTRSGSTITIDAADADGCDNAATALETRTQDICFDFTGASTSLVYQRTAGCPSASLVLVGTADVEVQRCDNDGTLPQCTSIYDARAAVTNALLDSLTLSESGRSVFDFQEMFFRFDVASGSGTVRMTCDS